MMRSLVVLLALCPFAAAAADTYAVDGGHTFPTFEYKHLGFSTMRGRFDKTSGTIALDAAKKSGSADITIDVGSVSTGVAKLDEHLKSGDFFDAAKYPTITFKSSDFRFEGDTLTAVAGDLTIHGVTRPVTLAVSSLTCKDHPMKKVPSCGGDASATIKRSDFGIDKYVPAVSDEITLHIGIEAQKQAPIPAP